MIRIPKMDFFKLVKTTNFTQKNKQFHKNHSIFIDGYGQRVLNTLRWISKIDEFPLILGREFCGVVRAKGKSVRNEIQIGDKVWGVVSPHQQGSIAQYVVVDQLFVSFSNFS